MLLGETNLSSIGPSCVGDGGQTSAARRLTNPGGDDALRRGKDASLFVELADGSLLEALAWLETSGRRLPSTRRALEQEHTAVLPDRQEAGDEIRLQSVPVAKISVLLCTRQVYGPQGRFANRLKRPPGAVATRER